MSMEPPVEPVTFNPSWDDLEKRSEALRSVGVTLKSEFVGMDEQIDTILNAMRAWYLLPDTLQRPVVIGLWGRTGVGKTSVVLRLVELLELGAQFGFEDLGKFTSTDRTSGTEDVGILEKFVSLTNQPSVFLFDEIQTARSISAADNSSIDRPNFRDLWAMLDTGKVPRDLRSTESYVMNLSDRLRGMKYSAAAAAADTSTKPPTNPWEYGFAQWDMDYMRRLLGLKKEMMEESLMKNPREFLEWVIAQYERARPSLAFLDFSKSLIFVAGNLDETFGASRVIDPDQMLADDLSDSTKDLTVNDAKAGLLSLFRPEQVARLGSTHIVFHGFNRTEFGELIDRKLSALSARLEKSLRLRLHFDHSIQQLFLEEAVIPAQGARPVISLIGEFLETQIPAWVLGLGPRSSTETSILKLRFDAAAGTIIAEHEGASAKRFESRPSLTQTGIRRKLDDPVLRKVVAIHEAGHAVVGIVLLGILPKRIFCATLKPVFGGHVEFDNAPLLNRALGIARLASLLGGVAAEQQVFGNEELTNGSQEDLRNCTRLVTDLVSQYGMSDHVGLASEDHPDNLTTLKKADDAIKEKWLQEALSNARTALASQPALFHALAQHLTTQPSLSGEALEKIVAAHYHGAHPGDAKRLIDRKRPLQYEAYDASADRFFHPKKQ